ncbi:MAG: HU family DNA-binding protein [Prevotella sp.]|nr:HU family DNA-binding protein [Prevotella sp.]
MAVMVKLYENEFGNEKTRGKWFARVVRTGTTDIAELAERIQRNSTFKTGEVRGIIIELVEEIKRCLQDGQTVDLEGLGRFHLTVESRHVDRKEDFRTDRDVTAVKCKFKPAGRRRKDGTIQQLLAEGAEVQRWKE